jgi:hypothetical protein
MSKFSYGWGYICPGTHLTTSSCPPFVALLNALSLDSNSPPTGHCHLWLQVQRFHQRCSQNNSASTSHRLRSLITIRPPAKVVDIEIVWLIFMVLDVQAAMRNILSLYSICRKDHAATVSTHRCSQPRDSVEMNCCWSLTVLFSHMSGVMPHA